MSKQSLTKDNELIEEFMDLVRDYGKEFDYCEKQIDELMVQKALIKLIKEFQ